MVTAMTLRAGLVLLGLGAVLLAGCGGQDPTAATSSPPLQQAMTTHPTPVESTPEDAEASETDESEAMTDLVGFNSPSGNVGCILESTYVRCDISERDWSPPCAARGL
jgi:hypothetical protein